MSLEAALQRLWYGPRWLSLPLWPLGWAYRSVVAARRGLAVVTAASRFLTRRVWMPVLAVVGIAASVAAHRVAGVNEAFNSADHVALRRLETCGPDGVADRPDRFRATFLEARRFEARAGRTCQKRRFFLISRFDQPLALQPVPYSSLVFEARGSRLIQREARRAAPGGKPHWCDYVIVRKDERDVRPAADPVLRLRGRGLVEPVGEAGNACRPGTPQSRQSKRAVTATALTSAWTR